MNYMYNVLLYYKYIEIQNPIREVKTHRALCDKLGIKGRIIIANEGINGTVAGTPYAIQAYKTYMKNHPLFFDIVFKESSAESQVFPKLKIKVREEIVSLKTALDITRDNVKRGKYIEPEDLYALMQSDEEYYIVDVRNDYETYIGKFKNSIPLPIKNFRELPDGIKDIEHLKKKKIVTVCTGGIRCEKASAYLIQQGFEDVSQLHGGIVTYGNKYPDEGYEGSCYVFDSRVAVQINSEERRKIISSCYYCHTPTDRYINCCNAACNKQYVSCEACQQSHQSACCDACKEKSRYHMPQCLEEHMN